MFVDALILLPVTVFLLWLYAYSVPASCVDGPGWPIAGRHSRRLRPRLSLSLGCTLPWTACTPYTAAPGRCLPPIWVWSVCWASAGCCAPCAAVSDLAV